jgi:hypothetical protein
MAGAKIVDTTEQGGFTYAYSTKQPKGRPVEYRVREVNDRTWIRDRPSDRRKCSPIYQQSAFREPPFSIYMLVLALIVVFNPKGLVLSRISIRDENSCIDRARQ